MSDPDARAAETHPDPVDRSEALQRLMVGEIEDYAIIMIDPEGRVTNWNKGAERIFGYTEPEMLGQDASRIFTPEDIEGKAPEQELETARAQGRAVGERWYVRRDQSRFWASGVMSATRDGGGILRGFVTVARDLTERKLAEEQRAEILKLERMARTQSEAAQKRVSTILESITDGFIAFDRTWRFTYLNHEGAKTLGRRPAELIGKNVWEEFPALEGTSFGQFYRQAVAEGCPAELEDYYPPFDAWFSVRAYPSKDGLSLYVLDITRRKQAEEALAARARLATFGAEVGVALTQSETLREMLQRCAEAIVRHLDAAFARIWTLREGEQALELQASAGMYTHLDGPHSRVPVGQFKIGLIAAERRAHLTNSVADDPRVADHQWARREGMTAFAGYPLIVGHRLIGVMAMFARQPLAETILESLAAVANSIAVGIERKWAEEERERLLAGEQSARQEAEQANHIKDEFLATLSHELRTPLTAMLGWARMLATGGLDAGTTKRAVETIERNAFAQSQLIEDLLDVSRIITGKLRLDVRPVDLAAVIESAADTVRPAADAKSIRWQAVLDPRAGPVSGDPERLQQVIWNLLSNAVKFTPKGGRVQARLERVNSHVEITISDTGQGIPADVLPHIFERFRQADSSSTRRHGGLGLGLAIVRQLVEMHGGTVWVESAGEGQGATFKVKLPLMISQRDSGDLERRHPKAAGAGFLAFDCPPALEGLRVLVVDDERDSRELITAILTQCGAEVVAVGSTRAALEEVERQSPDVLVSDIGMPDEDGYSLIAQLRRLPAGRGGRVPAAALTAYAGVEDRLRVLSAGFQMHVPKPVEPAELATVVASLAGRNARE